MRQQCRKQIELLLEQPLIVAQFKTEQRKRFRERAAAKNDFRAPTGDRIERGEALEHPDRIVRTEHRHRRSEPDAPGARCDRGQQHLGRRDRKIGAVVFADADEVDAEAVGEHGFLDHVAQHLRLRQRDPTGAIGDVAERIET